MENKLLLPIILFIGLVVLIVGGVVLALNSSDTEEIDDGQQDETVVENDVQKSIVEIASENSALSTLVTAVDAGELVDALSDEDASLTVFAPTNAAFTDIQDTVDTLLEPENKSDLQNVLQYHVVNAKVLSNELTDGQTVETLNGDMLKVRIIDGDVYINNAMVQTPDVMASNGVVHIIDTVLVPGTFGNVVETATETDSLSTLVTAVQAADLVNALSDNDGTFTVFAPTNAAFADIQDTVDTLLKPENKDDLQTVLQFHVVPVEAFSTELSDGQTVETLTGETLTIEVENGNVYITGEKNRAMVTTPDVKTSNGVVHIIDTVLLP